MRVLVLPSFYPCPHEPHAGIFFKEQCQSLAAAGLDVSVIFAETRRLRQLSFRALLEQHFQVIKSTEGGVDTTRLRGWNPLMATLGGGRRWTKWMTELVRSYFRRYGRPDIVHAHNSLWAGYAASQVAHELNVPYVVTEHSSDFLFKESLGEAHGFAKEALSRSCRVLAVSSALAKAMERHFRGLSVQVVPNVVDTDFFVPPLGNRPKDRVRFLVLARLIPAKRVDWILRSFANAFRLDARLSLEVGGDGPERPGLEKLASELGIASQVTFLGALSREQVRQALWRANAFVLASEVETFGVVFAEAMSTGLPVISTDSGGPKDIVTRDSGILVPANDENALTTALEKMRGYILNNHFDSALIRKSTINRFGRGVLINTLSSIYGEIIENKCRQTGASHSFS